MDEQLLKILSVMNDRLAALEEAVKDLSDQFEETAQRIEDAARDAFTPNDD